MTTATIAIPTPEDVDAAFLTAALRAAGHPALEVRGFEARPVGTGQLGHCVRYALDLREDAAGAPRSLIGKFPSPDPSSRAAAVQLRSYLKEVRFYQELQPRLRIRTPRCYHAAIAGEGPEFVLLLEDLAPAVQGDQLAGCSVAVARAALRELVGLHAPTWDDASLRGIDWLGEPDADSVALGRALYRGTLPTFLGRFAERLAADELAILERVAESQGPPFEALGSHFAAVHVDYRLDNLLVEEGEGEPVVTTVDWQSVTVGRPLSDVAYLLGAGLHSDVRREHERALVADYHRGLCDAGVSGYDLDAAWADYRRGSFAGFAVTVIASVMVQKTGRGEEMFTAMARRHARHALDLDAGELL